ncbi:zinc metalloproteinase nas-4-like isoform X2 [Carassius auratus]|uniref:Zinc metalloproteinase nas-4-like isoform X2 n=1 Tax=Carassius auratus TaxID=7957 RepID=A0A6P6J2H6_CARAU|nr:zinc metalloproteinase nas-4-like isoform X2 [Carassius auratus]
MIQVGFHTETLFSVFHVPFLTSYDRSVIVNNHSKNCIRFVVRSTQADYISIEKKDGCYSSLGRTGGKQVVSFNTASISMSSVMPWASTMSKPGEVVTRIWTNR